MDYENELKKIYDEWEKDLLSHNKIQNNFSSMFRMGFPEQFYNENPLIMYVGQECRNCADYKTQEWIRKFQTVHFFKNEIDGFDEKPVGWRPFWKFYRDLSFNKKYNVLWNNLDKFHLLINEKDKLIDKNTAALLNKPYTDKYGIKLSILQREINLLKPSIIVLAIGKRKYLSSLASCFSLEEEQLKDYQPTKNNPIHEISNLLNLNETKVFWTYHPKYLRTTKIYGSVLEHIKNNI